jgi:hypothetical protein
MMKLYDVIRKESLEQGTPLVDTPVQVETPSVQLNFVEKPFVWRKIFVIGAAVLFVMLLYIAGMKMVRTTVVINERRIPFSLDGAEFELVHEGDMSTGRLSFQTMVVSTEVTRQVYGSQVEPSTSIAKGKVVFFNEYSTKAQVVKAKTTITGTNKKTYQTTETVTVPGYTIKSKVKTAGTSPAVAVVATAVGPTFNTTGTTFNVAGWSGARSKQFYAQSAGAITGGEDGVAHSLSQSDQGDTVATLQAQLSERLKRETRAQIPESLITFPELQVITIDNNSLQLKGSTIKFPASIKGEMTTYLIPQDVLEVAIANHVLSDHTYARVSIPTLNNLTVVPISDLPTDPKNTPDTIRVKISGEGTIFTKAPLESIKDALVGASKHNLTTILGAVPEVDSAQAHFYPFWAPFFPNNRSRITVIAK